MGTLQENVAAAAAAANYTNAVLRHGAVNRPEGVFQVAGALVCMTPTRVFGAQTENQRRAHLQARLTGNQLQEILALGEASVQRGCGHCGEMSAVAFRFLYDRRVTPIDYVQATNFDHAFVVVGRAIRDDVPEAQQMDPAQWGPAAAVCDPHQRSFYPAAELRRRMHPGNGQFQIIVRHPRYSPPVHIGPIRDIRERLRPNRLLGPR